MHSTIFDCVLFRSDGAYYFDDDLFFEYESMNEQEGDAEEEEAQVPLYPDNGAVLSLTEVMTGWLGESSVITKILILPK